MPPREPGKETPRARRKALNERLSQELKGLQSDLRAILERSEIRIGGRLNEVIARLDGDPSLDQLPRPVPIRTAQAMLEAIAKSGIKAGRGKAKDLARLESLVKQLRKLNSA